MYDGADLSAVYGGMSSYDQPMQQQPTIAQPMAQPTQQPSQLPPAATDANVYGKPSIPPVVVENFSQPQYVKSYNGSDTLWDKIGKKKPEVIKMIVLSLVIVLGFSLDRLAGHYMTDYISKAILTNIQEFMVRISYPVGIILLLWIMKASM